MAGLVPAIVIPGRCEANPKWDHRHCERSEAIQNLSAEAVWIASSLALLAMTAERPQPQRLNALASISLRILRRMFLLVSMPSCHHQPSCFIFVAAATK